MSQLSAQRDLQKGRGKLGQLQIPELRRAAQREPQRPVEGLPSSPQISAYKLMGVRKVPQGWGKNHSNELEGTVFEAYTGPGIILILISHTGKTS